MGCTAAAVLRLEQLVGRDAERGGDALQIVERDVAGLPLNTGDKSAVQAALEGKRRSSIVSNTPTATANHHRGTPNRPMS